MRLMVTIITLSLTGCGLFENVKAKDVGSLLNDSARLLCEAFYGENPDGTLGVNPREICGVHKNVAPFLEEIMAARSGMKAKLSQDVLEE